MEINEVLHELGKMDQGGDIMLKNTTYDILKYIALVALPALAVFYSTISNIWNLPFHDAVPDTIMAVDLFLGALLKISTDKYNKEQGAE